jgi:signal peptidase I
MEKIIKKINLKTFSVIGIILSVSSVSSLILSAILSNSGNEELSTFDSWAAITLFLAVIYLLVFSILNLFKPRKTLSILGIILSLLAVILGSIVVIKYPPITLIDKLGDFLFLFSSLFLGIISIISFIKSIYEPVIETSKPESKSKRILKKVLWIIGALLIGFIITILINGIFVLINPSWEFNWIGFSLGGLVTIGGVVIIFIISKKIISKKVGRKTAKVFLSIFSLLIISSLVRHFFIQNFLMGNEWLEPYLHKGDFLLLEKFNKSIEKRDIVITRTRNDFIVSLVIGLPGDKIELKDGTFFVNGEPIKNVSYNFYHVYGIDNNTGNYFIVVPPDSFFGIPTLLEDKFADNEQKTNEKLPNNERKIQKHQTTSNSLCPYENSYFNPKDNLCYCKEGYVFNEERTKCITYDEACLLLYGPHSIAGEGDVQNKFLCYCENGFIWNKKEGKDKKCVKGIYLSVYLYKQSDILGKVIYPTH